MSKVKTPQEKKQLSYAHDRRNTYGENQKSSRKNIPRSKQLSHQAERRTVRQSLVSAQGDVADAGWNKGLSIPLKQVTRIAELGASMEFDIYAYGEDE